MNKKNVLINIAKIPQLLLPFNKELVQRILEFGQLHLFASD